MQEAILSLNARGRAKGHILAFLTVFVWGITFMLPFLPAMGFGRGAEGAGLAGLFDPIMLGNLLFLGLIASACCRLLKMSPSRPSENVTPLSASPAHLV